MKKRLYLVPLALLAMVSCTNDDIVQINKGNSIEFRTSMTTRATELTENNLNQFYVVGLYGNNQKYFEDDFVRNGTYFESGTKYYWPVDDQLKFFAYSPTELPGTVTINSEAQEVTDFTPDSDISKQVDFVATWREAYKKDADAEGGVLLNFKHALSQIAVCAKNQNKGYNIWVKAIRIKNVAPKGNYGFASAGTNWEPDYTELTSYEVRYAGDVNKANSRLLAESAQTLMLTEGDNAMLIPQSRPMWAKATTESSDPTVTSEEGGSDVTPDDEGTTGSEENAAPATDPNGSYIALLIRIETATGSAVFPKDGSDKDGFAWVAASMPFNWQPGYKYTYELDLSDGAGVVAPDQSEDPDGWKDNEGGDDGEEEDPNPDEGEDVFGKAINVDVTFGSWNSNSNYYNNVDMKPQEPQAPDAGEGGEGNE